MYFLVKLQQWQIIVSQFFSEIVLTPWCYVEITEKNRGESRLAPCQWETWLQSNAVSLAGCKSRISPGEVKAATGLLIVECLIWICPRRKENMTWKLFSYRWTFLIGSHRRAHNATISSLYAKTTSRRRFDAIMTLSLRRVYAGIVHRWIPPAKRQQYGALVFSLLLACLNSRVIGDPMTPTWHCNAWRFVIRYNR